MITNPYSSATLWKWCSYSQYLSILTWPQPWKFLPTGLSVLIFSKCQSICKRTMIWDPTWLKNPLQTLYKSSLFLCLSQSLSAYLCMCMCLSVSLSLTFMQHFLFYNTVVLVLKNFIDRCNIFWSLSLLILLDPFPNLLPCAPTPRSGAIGSTQMTSEWQSLYFMVWPLVGQPCFTGWTYSHSYMGCINWTQWIIKTNKKSWFFFYFLTP